jgi:hypothetical protein
VPRHELVPERDVFKSIDPCSLRYVLLRIRKLRLQNGVFPNAAHAIKSEHVSRQTPVNDTFATQTGHICDPRECRAVLTDGRVGRKGKRAATTFARKCATDPSVSGTT